MATTKRADSSARRLSPPEMFYVTGSLGSDPYLDGENVLVSAGVAWRNPGDGFTMTVPDADTLFVDSGGYQLTVHFGGEYPYSAEQYFEWADGLGADYVAGMDWVCASTEAIADESDDRHPSDIASIPARIEQTIERQVARAQLVDERDWAFEFVPVLQGETPSDYRYCARRLRDAGVASTYMGIGSTCKRDPPEKTLRILEACHEELPGTEFHLFGATKSVVQDRRFWGQFASGDTNSWQWKTPDGDLTRSKDEFGPALEAYQTDVDAARDQMAAQERLGAFQTARDPIAEAAAAAQTGWTCGCGTEIPAYGLAFDPQCRACEATKVNRRAHQQASLEAATDPAATARGDTHSTGTLAASGYSDQSAAD